MDTASATEVFRPEAFSDSGYVGSTNFLKWGGFVSFPDGLSAGEAGGAL
jgi:hypothetical protein